MKLNEAQNSFKDLTLNPHAQMDLSLRPARGLSQQQAFTVYRQNYIDKLTAALLENFASIQWLLGQRLFTELCVDYISQQPATAYDLHEYGEEFPDFVRSHSMTQNIPFLKDMARLEWTHNQISRAKTPDPLPKERSKELITSPNFTIRFISSMDIFESAFAISELWSCHKNPNCDFEDIQWSRPENILIFKKSSQVHVHKIERCQAAILQDLHAGELITAALARHASHLTTEDISNFFEFIIDCGLIEDIQVLES